MTDLLEQPWSAYHADRNGDDYHLGLDDEPASRLIGDLEGYDTDRAEDAALQQFGWGQDL